MPSASSPCAAGQTATFILEHVSDRTAYQTDLDDYVSGSFKETMNFWREWLGRSSYSGRWRDEVHRSALTLKLLHARGSGAIVAAATFGLPEAIGGRRNWDYRYSWIRDASFTMYALTRLGMTAESGSFIDWLVQRFDSCQPENLRTMYTIAGGSELTERTLGPSRGVSRIAPGPDRERGFRPAAAGHLRRADRCDLPVRQVRPGHEPRSVATDRGDWWTGWPKLAAAR